MKKLFVIALFSLSGCSVSSTFNTDYLQGTWEGQYEDYNFKLCFEVDHMTIVDYNTGIDRTGKYRIKGDLIIPRKKRDTYRIIELDENNLKLAPAKNTAFTLTFLSADYKRVEIGDFPIPTTLEECFERLDKAMPEAKIKQIKSYHEEEIRNDDEYFPLLLLGWKIHEYDAELAKYFNEKGLYGLDKIYHTILVSYHRYLNNEEIKLEDQINKYDLRREEYLMNHEQELQRDTIDNICIPRNLEDCFIQLDKLLSEEDKRSIQELQDKKATIRYHLGLGMWIRNNWGLRAGSRLKKYMLYRKIDDPDEMSAIILEFYYDWLNERHDKWKEFDAKTAH